MDPVKDKLRTDLDALTQQANGLAVRLEALERQEAARVEALKQQEAARAAAAAAVPIVPVRPRLFATRPKTKKA